MSQDERLADFLSLRKAFNDFLVVTRTYGEVREAPRRT